MQGIVAKRFRYGGQCNNQFADNKKLNGTEKEFVKSVNICQKYGQRCVLTELNSKTDAGLSTD